MKSQSQGCDWLFLSVYFIGLVVSAPLNHRCLLCRNSKLQFEEYLVDSTLVAFHILSESISINIGISGFYDSQDFEDFDSFSIEMEWIFEGQLNFCTIIMTNFHSVNLESFTIACHYPRKLCESFIIDCVAIRSDAMR